MGFAVTLGVLLDGIWLADTAAKSYLFVPLDPGQHQIVSKSESTGELVLNVEAGKYYSVWQEIKMGWMSARSALHLLDENEGRAGVAECSLKVNLPPRPVPAALGAACAKDTDCKGDRICQSGACVDARPRAGQM
jgi:hypothetical protein